MSVWIFMLFLPFLNSALGTVQIQIPDKPFLIIGADCGEGLDSVTTVWDVAMDDQSNLYVVDKANGRVFKTNPNGTFLCEIANRSMGNASLGNILWARDTLWVIDIAGEKILMFQHDKWVKDIKLTFRPYSLVNLGQLICVCPMYPDGEFVLLDFSGKRVRSFHTDSNIAGNLSFVSRPPEPNLWRVIKTIGVDDNQLLLNFTYYTKMAFIDLSGKLLSEWDTSATFFFRSRESRFGTVPRFFSTTSTAMGPRGAIWVSSCSKDKPFCGRLSRFHPKSLELIQTLDMQKSIRRIRFFNHGKTLAIFFDEGVYFYQLA